MFINTSATRMHKIYEMIIGRLSFEELFGNKRLKNSDTSGNLTRTQSPLRGSSANRSSRPGDMFRDYRGLQILELERRHVQRLLDLGS